MSSRSFGHRLLQSVLLSLITLAIVVLVVAGGAALAFNRKPPIEKGSWLVIDLYGTVHEYAPPSGVLGSVLGDDALVLQDIVDGLHKAARDDRIAGVLWKLSASNSAGLAKLEEMRAATADVRAAGKPVIAWGDNLDLRTLYLASACEKVVMPPAGYCEFKGLATQAQFFRAMLDKLGVVPHISKIREYKAAAEMVMDTRMSDAARANRAWMLEEYWNEIIPTLARERAIEPDSVTALMTHAEFLPTEARAAHLIDDVSYWQELTRSLAKDDDELPTVSQARYRAVPWKTVGVKGKDTIAVIHAQGMIGGRENRVDPMFGVMMGHETIVSALHRARKDDKVKAVVFRIDSGGGESLASDLISHEVELTAKVKPVVVSMVDVAASGGYMIAYKATRLMADPMSVTGSIGSISGFFNARGLYDKLGITKDTVALGPMAELGTDYRDPTAAEWARFTDNHERDFDAWLRQVAEYRKLPYPRAQELAYGRVFSGRQAMANGLVDTTGSFSDAVALAAGLARLPADRTPKVVHLPERKSLLQSIFSKEKPDAPVAALVRWAIYDVLRQDVRGSVAALATTPAVVHP